MIGGADIGQHLVESCIDGLFFTGSNGTGQNQSSPCGTYDTVGMELGGKDPCYVSDDVNAEVAAAVATVPFIITGRVVAPSSVCM